MAWIYSSHYPPESDYLCYCIFGLPLFELLAQQWHSVRTYECGCTCVYSAYIFMHLWMLLVQYDIFGIFEFRIHIWDWYHNECSIHCHNNTTLRISNMNTCCFGPNLIDVLEMPKHRTSNYRIVQENTLYSSRSSKRVRVSVWQQCTKWRHKKAWLHLKLHFCDCRFVILSHSMHSHPWLSTSEINWMLQFNINRTITSSLAPSENEFCSTTKIQH